MDLLMRICRILGCGCGRRNKQKQKQKQGHKSSVAAGEKPVEKPQSIAQVSVPETGVLPSDLVYEILGQMTTLETLDTSKAVCKSWNEIILRDVSFMPFYCRNTKNIYGYLIQGEECGNVILSIMNERDTRLNLEDIKILASSMQGIVCCVKGKYTPEVQYLVCKPTTGQQQVIPNPEFVQNYHEIVGLMILKSKPLCYKIVRIATEYLEGENNHRYNMELFDSRTWKWRRILDESFQPSNYFYQKPIYAGGSVYFNANNRCILGIRADDEAILHISIPQCVYYGEVVGYQGKLGYICIKGKNIIQLWILEDANKTPPQVWKKIKEVDMMGFLLHDILGFHFYNSEILFMNSKEKVVFYNLQDHTCKQVNFTGRFKYSPHIFPLRSDWEPIDLRGVDKF